MAVTLVRFNAAKLLPHSHVFSTYTSTPKPIKSANSLPPITYECANNETPENMREIEYNLYCQHKNHESGMMKLCSKPLGNIPILFATKSSTLTQLFEHEMKGSLHGFYPKTYYNLLGNGLSTLYGEEHRKVRKILNPLFLKEEALKQRFEIIHNCTKQLFDKLLLIQNTKKDEYIHLWPVAKEWAFDIILYVTFGDDIINEDKRDKLLDHFTNWAAGFMDTNFDNLQKPHTVSGNAMLHRQLMSKELEILIFECIKRYNLRELDTKCTMYKLLDAITISKDDKEIDIKYEEATDKEAMDINQVIDNILVLLFAGHDTTASSCCNIVYCLNKFSGNAFVEQLKQYIISLQSEDKLFDYDILMNHQYLDCFVNEVMRYISPVPLIRRQFYNDSIINDYNLKKDTKIIANLYNISKDDEIFENSLQFNPLRFIDNEPNKKIWYPFGLGSRKCLGHKMAYLELKIFTAMFCTQRKFEIHPKRIDKAISHFNFFDVYGKFC